MPGEILQAAEESAGLAVPLRIAKKTFRRRDRDGSQLLRRILQVSFILVNLYIGLGFWRFVRHLETGGPAVSRPAGVEGWLPIAGLMNLRLFLLTGSVPAVHPAAMILLLAFLAISFVFRKAFCGWLCPIGTLSEGLWKLGRKLFGRNWALPRLLDVPLRGLKYLLFGFFASAVMSMSAATLAAFMQAPYGLIADVKMLNFFRAIGETAAVTLVVLALFSVVYQNFWCRYLCPYGALMGLAALVSPARIRRAPETCIDCAKCARACPALLPVDRLINVRSAECMSCLECVAVCPAEGALSMSLPRRRRVPAWAMAAGIMVLFGAIVGYAKWTGHWNGLIPETVYRELIMRAGEYGHPGM
jgi:polyferredoxin